MQPLVFLVKSANNKHEITFLYDYRTSWLGKALRIDVRGTDPTRGKPYRIPRDNPFLSNSSFLPEIYAYGFRNIWRCDMDEGDPVTSKYPTNIVVL